MTVFTFAAAVVASLQATRVAGQGFMFSAPEPLVIALWGMALFVLATKARHRLSTTKSEPAAPR